MWERIKHLFANYVVTRPTIIDRYVWLRRTERAAALLNAKFDKMMPRNFRMAANDYDKKKWDFFEAAKFFLDLKPETIVAIFSQWFVQPGFDPKFKPSVIMNLWLTLPLPALIPQGLEGEEKDNKIKELTKKIEDVAFIMGESNPDLVADFLQNMSVAGAISFLEKTGAPPIMMVFRKIIPFETTIKLLNALRGKNPDRFVFWFQKFPIEDAAKIRMKLLEIDRMTIEEFKLKNEKMKFQNGELSHKKQSFELDVEQYKKDAEILRYKNETAKFQKQLKNREEADKSGMPQMEEEQRQRQASLEESVANLATTLNMLIKQYADEGKTPSGSKG